MGVVNEAVEDGVGISWVADEGVPFVDRDLAGEDGRAAPVTVLEDLVEVTTGAGVERFEAPIVEQEAEPVSMSERGGFVGSFELGKRLGHARQAKLAQLVEHWMGKHCILLSCSSAVRGYWGGGSARHWR